jgi:hypothetical protein
MAAAFSTSTFNSSPSLLPNLSASLFNPVPNAVEPPRSMILFLAETDGENMP